MKRATEGMKDTYHDRSKVFGFVSLVKHTKNNTADSIKEAVEKRTVKEEKEAAEE